MATRQTAGIAGISTYLKNTLLPGVSTLRLTNIYDHELTDLAGFPAATITLQESAGKILDNTRNLRTYHFTIRVFIDRSKQNFGSSKAETVLRAVADEITLALDGDPTLGGNCINAQPFDAKFGYVDRESNDIRLMEITLECTDAVSWR